MKIVEPSVELLFVTPGAEKLLEAAGRTCYKSEDRITEESAEAFVKMIEERRHVSVIEHAYAIFRIVTDRGITHEIVRHRIASYSQESTRYCNYSKAKFGKEITVVAPCGVREGNPDGSWEIWRAAMRYAERSYFDLLDTGHGPQIARSVLPTCLKTEIVMTANFREWMHFLALRTSEAAHPDMRVVASMIANILAGECPILFARFAGG